MPKNWMASNGVILEVGKTYERSMKNYLALCEMMASMCVEENDGGPSAHSITKLICSVGVKWQHQPPLYSIGLYWPVTVVEVPRNPNNTVLIGQISPVLEFQKKPKFKVVCSYIKTNGMQDRWEQNILFVDESEARLYATYLNSLRYLSNGKMLYRGQNCSPWEVEPIE